MLKLGEMVQDVKALAQGCRMSLEQSWGQARCVPLFCLNPELFLCQWRHKCCLLPMRWSCKLIE